MKKFVFIATILSCKHGRRGPAFLTEKKRLIDYLITVHYSVIHNGEVFQCL